MRNSFFFLFISAVFLAFPANILHSQHIFFENGSPSHPEVLHYQSDTRSIIDLSGKWEVSLDEGKTWQEILVPSASSFEGRMIFRRNFSVETDIASKASFKLAAYGINYQSEVYINEVFIGKHEGGYTSFSLLVPENIVLPGKENVIRIVVDNSLTNRTTLPVRQQIGGWKNYGGIIRDLFIVATPKVWIDRLTASTESIESKGVRIAVTAAVSAKEIAQPSGSVSGSYVVTMEVIEQSTGTVVARGTPSPVLPEQNKDITVQISVLVQNAKFWSPETPDLYTVRATLVMLEGKNTTRIDEVSIHTGVRTLATDKGNILFNGAAMVLRGVAWIEDSPVYGSSLTYEEMEKDIALIKNLGANTIRCAFHPPHPFVVELCNRYGLMIMEEIPLYEVPLRILSDEYYVTLVENYLRDMIQRDKSEPAVIAWGVGEGVGISEIGDKGIIAHLHGIAKSQDDRFTYYISRRTDDQTHSTAVDIAALSALTNDSKVFKTQVQRWKDSHKTQPVIVGRYGKETELGNRRGYSDPMSQEAQARSLMQRYYSLKEVGVAGGIIWSFNDWRSDRPIMTVRLNNPETSTFGMVEMNREKKTAYDVVRSMFLGEKVAALPIGSFVPNTPYTYVLFGLVLLIIFAWLMNSNRRFRENVNRALLRPYNFFADIRDQRIFSWLHTIVLMVIVVITFGIVVSSFLFHYKTNVLLDYALSFLFPDAVKSVLIMIAWNPLLCIGYVALFMTVCLVVVTLLIFFFSYILRYHIQFLHAYAVSVWAALPLVVFIPLAMILFRVMENPTYELPVLSLFGLVLLWVLLRLLKGVSVIYNIYSGKIYILAVLGFALLAGSVYAYVDYAHAATAYIEHFFSVIVPSFHS